MMCHFYLKFRNLDKDLKNVLNGLHYFDKGKVRMIELFTILIDVPILYVLSRTHADFQIYSQQIVKLLILLILPFLSQEVLKKCLQKIKYVLVLMFPKVQAKT